MSAAVENGHTAALARRPRTANDHGAKRQEAGPPMGLGRRWTGSWWS